MATEQKKAGADDGRGIRLAALRRLVEDKFPGSAASLESGEAPGETGRLADGQLTEIHGSSGSVSLFLWDTLVRGEAVFTGWIDATDALEPGEFPASVLRRLLWVRCANATQAVQATDLLLRDGNLPLLVLDLRGVAAREFREIPASTWHRFQRLLEGSPVALAICTAHPGIAPARLRMEISGAPSLQDLTRSREELKWRTRVTRRSGVVERRTA